MEAERRAKVEFNRFKFDRRFAAEAFEVSRDVRAGAEKVGHHQYVVGTRLDALSDAGGDGWLGEFQGTRHNDRVVTLFSELLRDDDEVVIGLGSSASVGDQQNGGWHLWGLSFGESRVRGVILTDSIDAAYGRYLVIIRKVRE